MPVIAWPDFSYQQSNGLKWPVFYKILLFWPYYGLNKINTFLMFYFIRLGIQIIVLSYFLPGEL